MPCIAQASACSFSADMRLHVLRGAGAGAAAPNEGALRLADGASANEGRLEVFLKGKHQSGLVSKEQLKHP